VLLERGFGPFFVFKFILSQEAEGAAHKVSKSG